MYMLYNPFDKPIGEKIEEADLDVLVNRQVTEGYYVEYKRQFPLNAWNRERIACSAAWPSDFPAPDRGTGRRVRN
jgi:hypothetical protein